MNILVEGQSSVSDSRYLDSQTNKCIGSECCTVNNGSKIESKKHVCGVCSQYFSTICVLHEHMLTVHWLSESYNYHYEIQTAFPKYKSACQCTQTEEIEFDREGLYDKNSPDNACGTNMDTKCTVTKKIEAFGHKEVIEKEETDGYHSDQTDVYFEPKEAISVEYNQIVSSSVESGTENGKRRKSRRKNCVKSLPSSKKSQGRKLTTSRKSRRKPAVVCKYIPQVKDSNVGSKITQVDIIDSKTVESPKLKPDIRVKENVKTETDESENMESYNDSKCLLCGVTFSVKQALLRHEQQKHFDEMKYQCDKCDKRFMRNFNLQKHVSRVHNKSSAAKAATNGLKISGKSAEKSGDSIKSECNLNADKEETIKSNEKKVCRKRRTNAEVEFMKAPHTCEICGHTMPKYKMDVHKRLHTGWYIG